MNDLPREEVCAVVDRLVEQLLNQVGVDRPPVDAVAIATEHLGLVLYEQDSGRVVRRQKTGSVTVRADAAESERQWAAARAIANYYRPSLLRQLGLDLGERLGLFGGTLANLYARHLLLPSRWFAADVRACGLDLASLLTRYAGCDCSLLAQRLLDLPEPAVVTIVRYGRIEFRKSNGPRVSRQLQSAEQRCVELAQVDATQTQIVRADGWTVRGISVCQPEVRRIILVSQLEEFD